MVTTAVHCLKLVLEVLGIKVWGYVLAERVGSEELGYVILRRFAEGPRNTNFSFKVLRLKSAPQMTSTPHNNKHRKNQNTRPVSNNLQTSFLFNFPRFKHLTPVGEIRINSFPEFDAPTFEITSPSGFTNITCQCFGNFPSSLNANGSLLTIQRFAFRTHGTNRFRSPKLARSLCLLADKIIHEGFHPHNGHHSFVLWSDVHRIPFFHPLFFPLKTTLHHDLISQLTILDRIKYFEYQMKPL